jgi:hypothetical protein
MCGELQVANESRVLTQYAKKLNVQLHVWKAATMTILSEA